MIPQFLISEYLKSIINNNTDGMQLSLEELRKKLYEKGVLTKDYIDDNLVLLYHKYDSPVTNELERECRSLVIDRTTFNIVSYSCETPRLNNEGMEFLIVNPTEKQEINTCYEGTFLSIFFHGEKWYIATRRCLNSKDSVLTNTNVSHYEMFQEVLTKAGYTDFDTFSSKLDKSKSYYFVLIHHKNKNTIDYTKFYGDNYAVACLITIRDLNMTELDIYNENFINDVIFVPEKLASIDDFANFNKSVKYGELPTSEGIVIKVWNSKMNKNNLVKLQNLNYQFAQVVGSNNNNIYKGYIYLYQNNKLIDYFSDTKLASKRKVVNPFNPSESYDVIGLIDSAFKVCTSELYELFKKLWSLKSGQHQNKELYETLPKEYKDIMFAIKGIYYKKKTMFYENKIDLETSYLRISDIYSYLKALSTDTFIAFLRMRKLMLNWNKTFCDVSVKCYSVHLKLCQILTKKLYPNITNDDLPPNKVLQQTS
jgi:hypothetical protein